MSSVRPSSLASLQRASTRDRILEAAMRLFAELPYSEVQMDLVAHRAEVAKPTLYRYFATKELLFLTALDSFLGDLAAAVEEITAAPLASVDALARIVAVAFDTFARCTAALRAADGSEPGLGAKGRLLARTLVDELRRAIVGVLRRGIESGEIEDPDPETTALILLGAVRFTAARTSPGRRQAVLRRICAVVLEGVGVSRSTSSLALAGAQVLEKI